MTEVKRLLAEATPLPWDRSRPVPEREADAALIVHAVNRLPDYEAAVEALERVVNVWTGSRRFMPNAVADARAALARLRETDNDRT